MVRNLKDMVKDAIEELVADNAIIIEDDNGNRMEDFTLNVVRTDDDDDDIEELEDEDENEEEND